MSEPSSQRPHVGERVREVAAVIGCWALGSLVFFRAPLFSGFDELNGDRGDVRLIALLHEHWIDVVRGRASWRTPNFFHPASDTLGYSDTFVLNQVFYAPLRAVGLERYAALQCTLIALSLIGFVGVYLLCVRLIGARRSHALPLSMVAVFANNLAIQIGHPQMLGLHWLPLVILLVARAWTATTTRAQVTAGAAAGALYGAMLWSTYYISWFAALATLIAGCATVVQVRHRLTSVAVRRFFTRIWRPLAAAGLGFALLMVPFALTYLPTLRNVGGRRFSDAYYYSPGPADLVNVGDGNLFWGGTLRRLYERPARASNFELATAVTPLMVVTVLVCAVLVIIRLRGQRTVVAHAARSLLVTAVVLSLLPVHIGTVTLWSAVWMLPGATGIRAIGRVQVLNSLVASLAIVAALTALSASTANAVARGWKRHLVAVWLLVLVLEQVNTRDISLLDRPGEVAFMSTIPTPPAECDSFYIEAVPHRPHYASAIDAMIVAQLTGLPTINGYSGAVPPGWHARTDRPDYLDLVRDWIELHDLTNVCNYDPTSRIWSHAAP